MSIIVILTRLCVAHSLPDDFVIRAIVYTFFKVFNFSKNFKIVSVLFTGEWSL